MTTFSSLHSINNELFRFCFSEIMRMDSPKYYVAVKQDNQLVTAFEMKKDTYYNQWVICQPAPEWIVTEGAVLSQMIEEAISKKARQKSKSEEQHS